MNKFTKSEIIFIIALALLVIGFFVFRGGISLSKDRYAAVFLTSGEIYFGKPSFGWGALRLSDVWLLQRDQKGELSLNSFKAAFWQPKEPLNIKKDKIIFWANLEDTSPVIQAIQQQKQAATQPAQQLPPVATTTPQTLTPTPAR